MAFEKGKNREEKVDLFLDTLSWYHSEKTTPTGVFNAIGRIAENLQILNTNLVAANKSSDELTAALNKITLAGVWVAGLGLLIATGNLVLEIAKFAFGK